MPATALAEEIPEEIPEEIQEEILEEIPEAVEEPGQSEQTEQTEQTEGMLVEVGEANPHSFMKKWNDNNNISGERPQEVSLELYYALEDAQGNYYVLNAEGTDLEKADGAAAAVRSVRASDELTRQLFAAEQVPGGTDLANPVQNGSKWTYKLELPDGIKLSFGGEEPQDYALTISYGIREEDPSSGYLLIPGGENRNDGTKTELENTKTESFVAKMDWMDAENAYDSRPYNGNELTGKLSLKRYVVGNAGSLSEVLTEDGRTPLRAEPENGGSWNLLADGLPSYDTNGKPYIYYVDVAGTEGEQNFAANSGEGDRYTFLYDNVGTDYALDKGHLYGGGKVTNTLVNQIGYSVTKIWDDEEDWQHRPDCKLYLYRVAANMTADGTITYNPRNGSPVQGFDNRKVPKTDAEGTLLVPGAEALVTFADGVNQTIPKYDANGRLYVYYTAERGLTGAYRAIVEPGDTYLAQDEQGRPVEGIYVLNKGVLTNCLKEQIPITLTKIFEANAMQSLDPEYTSASFRLQVSTDEKRTWSDAKNEGGEVISVTLGRNSEESGTGTFRPESSTVVDQSVIMPQYNVKGGRLYYRWVETAMTVNGAMAENTDGFAEGIRITLDQPVAPGVGKEGTTAQFVPRYLHNEEGTGTTVTNVLAGEMQLKAAKYWEDENGICEGPADVEELTFILNQNGVRYDKFTVQKSEGWTTLISELPRYDEDGKEYSYTITEEAASGNPGWQFDRTEYSKTVAVDSHGNQVVQVESRTYNCKTGAGSRGLNFTVEKVWLDDNDLLSRREVTVGLFRDRDKVWQQEGGAVRLNEGNLYRHRFYYALPEGDAATVDDFIVMEIDVNGVPVKELSEGSPDPVSAMAALVRERQSAIQGLSYFEGKSTADTEGMAVGQIGVLTPGKQDERVNHQYYTYVGRNSRNEEGTYADYTIYNQRFGTLDMKLTKSWAAGGETPMAEFEVYRKDEPDKVVEAFTLGDKAVGDSERKSQFIPITGLAKYDAVGKLLSYGLRETKIGGVPIQNGMANVAGDTYVSNISQESVHYADARGHRTGDVYIWSGSNVRQETYNLTVNKVWQDDGYDNEIARPDVRFTVYRTTEVSAKAMQMMTVEQAKALAETSEPVLVDNLWDTTHNAWYWSCDLGAVPRYDAEGYPYVYFLTETVSANTAGYQTLYFNGADKPVGGPKGSTREVFAHPGGTASARKGAGEEGGYGHILVLRENNSCTTVNYRQKALTIRGMKLWLFPKGIFLSNAQLPSVNIHLYRSEEKLSVEPTYRELSALAEEPGSGVYEVNEEILNTAENGHRFSFLFRTDRQGEDLQYYDSYGISYAYYTAEEPVTGYPELQAEANLYQFTNVYEPQEPNVIITLKKDWNTKKELAGTELTATAKFELLAQCQDKDTGDGAAVGDPIRVAAGTLTAPHGKVLVFDKYNLPGDAFYEKGLPYYGPNGKPLRYVVKELTPNGYETTLINGTSDRIALTPQEGTENYSGELTVTNTYTGGETSYKVVKKWQGDSRDWVTAKYRPERLLLTLTRTYQGNDKKEIKDGFCTTYLLTGTGEKWEYTFQPIEQYAPNGNPYSYRVEETLPENAGPEEQKKFESYQQGKDGNGVLTNMLPTVKIQIFKEWKARTDGTDAARVITQGELERLWEMDALPETLRFELQYLDGGTWIPAGEQVTYTLSSLQAVRDMSKAVGNGLLWLELPKYQVGYTSAGENEEHVVKYRVLETVTEREETKGSWSSSLAVSGEGTGEISFRFANAISEEIFKTRELTVKKDWADDGNRDGIRPDSVTVQLKRDGENYRAPVNLREEKDWKYTWTALPLYRNGKMEKYRYTVEEAEMSPYEAAYSWESETTAAVTNRYEPKVFEIEASKSWSDYRDINQIRPQSVTLTLEYRDPAVKDELTEGAWKKVSTAENPQTIEAGILGLWYGKAVWTVPVNHYDEADKVSKPLKYRVVESGVESYAPAYLPEIVSGAEGSDRVKIRITNTLLETELTVTKIWEDEENRYDSRPDRIAVKLQRTADGENWTDVGLPGPVTLTKEDNWAGRTFEHLPVYADAENTRAYDYRAVETDLSEPYRGDADTITVTEGENRKFETKLTNSFEMPFLKASIKKHADSLSGKVLSGAVYMLAQENADGTTSYYAGVDKDGRAVWEPEESRAKELVTGADGAAKAEGLPYGSYWFKEVKAPKGYKLNSELLRFIISNANRNERHEMAQVDKALPKPQKSSSKPSGMGTSPKTGDGARQELALFGIGGAGAVLLLLGVRRKKRIK